MNKPFLINQLFPESFYERDDLVAKLAINDDLTSRRLQTFSQLKLRHWQKSLALLKQLNFQNISGYCITEQGVISTADEYKLNTSERELLDQFIRSVIPWRKGPWSLADYYIDTEWRCQIRYNLLKPLIADLKYKSVLDIGSGNGYFATRLLADGASAVLCLDPSDRAFLQFEVFQKFAKQSALQYEMLGFQDAAALGIEFDVVLCMGVFYHHQDPLSIIDACISSLKPGGLLILESMTHPVTDSSILFPEDRYAKARNVYFVPSSKALYSILKRKGLKSIELVNEREHDLAEQRRTELSPFESLADFLDPNNTMLTIEGYPAPTRSIFCAKKASR